MERSRVSHPHPSPQRLYTSINLGDLHQLSVKKVWKGCVIFYYYHLPNWSTWGISCAHPYLVPTLHPKGYTPTSTWEVCINLRKVKKGRVIFYHYYSSNWSTWGTSCANTYPIPIPHPKGYTPTSTWGICINLGKVWKGCVIFYHRHSSNWSTWGTSCANPYPIPPLTPKAIHQPQPGRSAST